MTLFEKYGGVPTVSRIVSRLYGEVASRPNLQPYFQGVDMARLIKHQVTFVSYLMGMESATQDAQALGAAHHHLRISNEAFEEVAVILQRVLEGAGMESQDIASLMQSVAATRAAIVAP